MKAGYSGQNIEEATLKKIKADKWISLVTANVLSICKQWLDAYPT